MTAALVFLPLLAPSAARATWKTFTARDGLASNQVNSVAEDRSGNLWFATDNGLTRYDGNWRTFTTADELPQNNANSVIVDHAGNLWVGTGVYPSKPGGVTRYDGSTWRTFTTADGLSSNAVTSVLEDRENNLWFVCNPDYASSDLGGVVRYNPMTSTWTNFDTVPYMAKRLFEDHAGNLWLMQSGYYPLSRFDRATSTWKPFTIPPQYWSLYSREMHCMAEDGEGGLWFGISGDSQVGPLLLRYDPSTSTWTDFNRPNAVVPGTVLSIQRDRSGNMWFGSTFGVSRYDGSSWQYFSGTSGERDPYGVRHIFQDSEGHLWFAGGIEGASRFDGSTWHTFNFDDGVDNKAVWSLCEDPMGNVWAGTDDGARRYDGVAWMSMPVDSLGSARVWHVSADRSGNVWIATSWAGASRYDGSTWRTFTTADGLARDEVSYVFEDRAGYFWFAPPPSCEYNSAGLSRYDPSTGTWRLFKTGDWLPGGCATSIAEDRDGNLWFGAYDRCQARGAARYTPSTDSWQRFTTADGLSDDRVGHVFKDHADNLWFGTSGGGASLYDGATWRSFTIADGLAHNSVNYITEDRAGNFWFATNGGVTRYDGSSWRSFTAADGLATNYVTSVLEDRAGNLWFGTYFTGNRGVTRYVPDRVPPHTAIQTRPVPLSPSRNQVATSTVLGEVDGLEYSWRLDGAIWSEWSSIPTWTGNGLPDGAHVLEARARDFLSNVDSTAAMTGFEIDATPPTPVIASPTFGQPVRGPFEILGTTSDRRFLSCTIEARPEQATGWSRLAQSPEPVENGVLTSWNTTSLPDGNYDLRLSVTDTLGLFGSVMVTVVVDNHAPFVDVTAPARVSAAGGGDIYTTNSELHLYFPPHAFDQDAVVSISATTAPDQLPPGATQADPGYVIGWGAATLRKEAVLEFSTAGQEAPPGTLAIYFSPDGNEWQRLGGTSESDGISLAVTEAGRYALYIQTASVEGAATLSELSFTPRVFSPLGGFAASEVGIGFTLGRSGPVTVRVYNRAGRLMREVAAGETLPPGANLLRWDGRDRDGSLVEDGLYLVTVEALGQSRRNALAVVR